MQAGSSAEGVGFVLMGAPAKHAASQSIKQLTQQTFDALPS